VGCGCNTQPTAEAYRRLGKATMEWFYRRKKEAEKKNLPFNLEPDDFADDKIPDKCPVLGIKLNKIGYGKNSRSDNSPSMDKFYPKLGYVKGNTHIISMKANRLKNDGTPEDWQKIAEWCKKEAIKQKLEGKHPEQQKHE
jgi:hypothetical protein